MTKLIIIDWLQFFQ